MAVVGTPMVIESARAGFAAEISEAAAKPKIKASALAETMSVQETMNDFLGWLPKLCKHFP